MFNSGLQVCILCVDVVKVKLNNMAMIRICLNSQFFLLLGTLMCLDHIPVQETTKENHAAGIAPQRGG